MKIVNAQSEQARPTTLNDIPVGTVFRGNVYGQTSKLWTRGVFYKAYGRWAMTQHNYIGDVIVIRLDFHQGGTSLCANLWDKCSEVADYEPLDAELVIKGVLK